MTGPPLRPEELSARTDADRRAQLDGGLAELACGRCGGRVRVEKHSVAHTAIQWSADAVHRCPAFTARDGCPHLRRSLDAAVAAGALAVPRAGPAPRGRADG